jgi:hypothetical protein
VCTAQPNHACPCFPLAHGAISHPSINTPTYCFGSCQAGLSAPGNPCRTQRACNRYNSERYTLLYFVQEQYSVGGGHYRETTLGERVHGTVIAQGTNVPHDGLAEAPVHLNASRHKSVSRVQVSRVGTAFALVAQGGSGATSRKRRQQRSGSEGKSWRYPARWDHGVGERVTPMSARAPDGQILQQQQKSNWDEYAHCSSCKERCG